MNYNLRIQCFKATLFKMENQLFLSFEQIMPILEEENFIISMAQKNMDNIEKQEEAKSQHKMIRCEFWTKMISEVNITKCKLYQKISPSNESQLSAGFGISGVLFRCITTKLSIRVELVIGRQSKEDNKELFYFLYEEREKIESKFSRSLIWERMDNKKMSSIKVEKKNLSIFDREDWDENDRLLKDNIAQI